MLKPLLNKIVVKRDPSREVTAGGIVIPDNFSEKADSGVVLAVGPGKYDKDGKLIKVHVKTGDRVLFNKLSGQTVEFDKQEYIIMTETDLMGIVHLKA